MSEVKHMVNKVVVNTSGITTEKAFKWRAQVVDYLNDAFPRQLQLILDELYDPEEQATIDRLQIKIDLAGTTGTELFQRELLYKLRKALADQKQETMRTKLQDERVMITATLNRSVDAWLFYIQKGYYPWFYQQVLERKELESLIEAHTEIIAHQLPAVLNSPQAQQRFFYEMTENILRFLLPYFVITKTMNRLFEEHLYIGPGRQEQIAKARQVLLRIMVNNVPIDEHRFIEMMGQVVDPFHPGFQEYGFLEKTLTAPPQNERSAASKKEDEAGIWIQNAGLILLHPFLPVLFERLSVTNGQKQIIDMVKAMGLIHYLLYAKRDYSDACMILPKVLCGIPYNNPVPVEHAINSDEQKECDELLLSVIEYWDALKNTSIRGLLETFVLRKGKMTPGDKGWLLQVENRTEDILLDRLPWSIGYVKLPWTTTLITTEWR